MYDFNFSQGESNVQDLVLRYEDMLAKGSVIFLEQEAFQDLIDYYEDNYLYDKALGVIDQALLQHAYSAIFHIRKAQLLLEEDQLEAANEALNMAKLYEPTNVDIFLTEAEIKHQARNYDEAMAILDNALIYADKEDLEDIYLVEATIHESREDYEASFISLVKVLKNNPFNDMAYSRLWLCMELTEAFEEGIKVHEEILERAPYSYWAWYNLAHSYMQLGLYEKAFEAYDYAIVINETFEFAYRDIISCLFRLEDYEQARRYVLDYKELFGNDAEVLLWEGECYEYSGAFDSARACYNEALKVDALDGRIHYRIGVSFANENNWRQALRSFEQAYQQNKENEEYCIALAEVYNQLDEVDMAHSFFNRAILLAPEEIITWISYIEFLIDEEAYVSAFETLNDARRYSDHVLYDYSEAALMILSGKKQEGMIQLLRLLEEHEGSYQKLFDIAPELEEDPEVWALIREMERGKGNIFNLN